MEQLKHKRIALIGGGHITEIILDNLIANQTLLPEQVIVSNRSGGKLRHLESRFGVTTTLNNLVAIQQADLILINVPPSNVPSVIQDLESADLNLSQIVISLAAGISLNRYGSLHLNQPLVRALPNPPSRIGQGVIALHFNQAVSDEQAGLVHTFFSTMGQVVTIEEAHFNVVTALTSPVATYLFFEALVDAGVRGGLKRPTATEIAAQTILGSMGVWQDGDSSPYQLMAEASTPAGISVESLFTLEKLGFKPTVMEAIAQGAARAEELGSSQ